MERKERRVLQLLVLSAMLLPLSSTSQGVPAPSSITFDDDNEPITPTGYAFANEIGGDILTVKTGPNGIVYALTSTGCFVCLDRNGTELWRRYIEQVQYMDYHVFPNGNMAIFQSVGRSGWLSHNLELMQPNGRTTILFEDVDLSYYRFNAFEDRMIFFERSDKICCIDQEGNTRWTFGISPYTMVDIIDEIGSIEIGDYKVRSDLLMTEDNKTLLVLYDDRYYGQDDMGPSLLLTLDNEGDIVSWFRFEERPIWGFNHLYDGSVLVAEQDLETEGYSIVRINESGGYQWRAPVDKDYGSMVMDGPDGRVLYYSLWSDFYYNGREIMSLFDLDGTALIDNAPLPKNTIEVALIGDRFLITNAGNGSIGEIRCYDRDWELLWKRTVTGGISSNIVDAGDGTFLILGNVSKLQRWTVEGALIWETRICTFDLVYMESYLGSVTSTDIGFVTLWRNFAIDDRGDILMGLMRLYKIDRDGTMVWDRTFDGIIESSPIEGANGDIIIGGLDGHLYSFDEQGYRNWAIEIGAPIASTPILSVKGDGYIVVDSMGSMRMVSPNGKVRWTCKLNGSVNTQPIQDEDGNIYAGTLWGTFYSIHPNGSVNWTLTPGPSISHEMHFIGDHHIYYFEEGDLVKIDLLNRSSSRKDYGEKNEFYSGPIPLGNGEMIGTNETLVWFDMEGNILRDCPDIEYLWYTSCIELGPDGRIYVGSTSGRLYCVLPNGSLDWSIEIGEDNVRPWFFGNGTLLVAHEGLASIDPITGEVIWNFMMDLRSYDQGYASTLPYVMEDGSILFAFDRIYRFTDSDIRGQMSDMEIEPYCSWDDVYWEFDIPPTGGFLSGFTIFKNGTDGVLREYMNVPFHQTRIDENKFTNSSLVYDYRVEWHDHLGNGGTTRVFNTSEDYGNYIDITPSGSEPRNLTLSFKDGKVRMDWEPPEDVEEHPVYSYRVYRYEDGEWVLVTEVGYNITHFEDGNISLYEGYWYSIVACTEHGESEGSDSRYIYTRGDLDETFFMIMGVIVVIYLALVVAGSAYVMGRNDKPTFFDERGGPITIPKGAG